MPDAKATGPTEVVVTKMPNRKHAAIRDKTDKVIGSIEVDED